MKLAINGGEAVRRRKFKAYNTIGDAEKAAAKRVLDRGVLSGFIGSWDQNQFYGGIEVQDFEAKWSKYFGCKHSVSVNSASSAIQIALGALDIKNGDEVIVSPYSMSVSATAPLMWGATPVFADIDPNHYNMTPESIKSKITSKTKAIIVVHIFGCPADMDEIMAVARENNIKVIEDASQSPGAIYKGKKAGTIGDIGVFSLNVHKHIQSGEGGVCVTDNDELAVRLQLLRNHSEAVVEGMGRLDLKNIYGFNFRITEIQAAIASVQLQDRLDKELSLRQEYAKAYDDILTKFDFIETTNVEADRTHAYYIQGFRFLKEKAGITREKFVDAVCAELDVVEGYESDGVQVWCGYTKPLYRLPIFGYDLNLPVVEDMYANKLFLHDFTKSSISKDDMLDVINAYQKVCENINELK